MDTTIHVKAATSSEAIQKIESLLMQSEGIERAIVDTDDGGIKIEYDQNKISRQQIITNLTNQGFHATSE